MSWKTQIQLLDYDSEARLEARCSGCGYTWYEEPCLYFHKSHLRQLFVDEFEAKLRCKQWNCKGRIRLSQTSEEETEGFLGGLA